MRSQLVVCIRSELVAFALAVLMVFVAYNAKAHEATPTAAAPKGWSYPFSCCSGFDCREVNTGTGIQVTERTDGYQISSTGEIIAYADKRIKDSPDGVFHWCSVQGADDGKTICLFVPPPAY